MKFGGSYPGFIVLNPTLFVGLPTPVKLWIFSHECAHQTAGSDEVKADCLAVQRGRREGWLTEDGLGQVCTFMKPAHADSAHFTGTERCALMQQCFPQVAPTEHPATKPTNPASHVKGHQLPRQFSTSAAALPLITDTAASGRRDRNGPKNCPVRRNVSKKEKIAFAAISPKTVCLLD
jgi:hypothetical protein